MFKKTWMFCISAIVPAQLIILSLTISTAKAESPFWGDLPSGLYDVGFETVEKYDNSRAFRDKYDYDGNSRQGETARPVQICVWYPAVWQPDDRPLVCAQYVFPAPEEAGYYNILAQLQGREIGYLMGVLRNRGLVQDLMNTECKAVIGAQRAEGSFPLIVYHPDSRSGISENATMCEFLASHGFIVATSHAIGAASVNIIPESNSLEAMVRDREFVYGFMTEYPNVDLSGQALVGYGAGASAALLMQMRNTDIDLVVALNPDFAYRGSSDLMETHWSYNLDNMHVPMLEMHIAGHEVLDLSFLESLKYSDRYSIGIESFTHPDFAQYAVARALLADTTTGAVARANDNYNLICHSVLQFVNANVKKDQAALKALAGMSSHVDERFPAFVSKRYEKEIAPPTQTQFMDLLGDDKIDRAVEIYEQLKAQNSDYVPFREATLNGLGYQLLQQNRLAEAKKVFKINTEAYPNSANVWDSYADACIAGGDTPTAVMCYEMVLQLLPADSTMDERTREYLRSNATQNLEALKQ